MDRKRAFTLIELLIVLTIISILAAIAYPTYNHIMTKARRSDGHMALLDLAARMERYYADNNTYAGASIATGTAADVLTSHQSPKGWYALTITTQNKTHFFLQAVPQKAQAVGDRLCGTLTYDSVGVKGKTGTGKLGDCW